MFMDSKAEMNLTKRAHAHMTMNGAVWKAGLVIICSFSQTAEGKNMFLSIDSRLTKHNPLFKAWKTKSFTDGDIILHFIIMDILSEPGISMALGEITDVIDEYLSKFSNPRMFDESTVRKKLKKYVSLGILTVKETGKDSVIPKSESVDLPTKVC